MQENRKQIRMMYELSGHNKPRSFIEATTSKNMIYSKRKQRPNYGRIVFYSFIKGTHDIRISLVSVHLTVLATHPCGPLVPSPRRVGQGEQVCARHTRV